MYFNILVYLITIISVVIGFVVYDGMATFYYDLFSVDHLNGRLNLS